MLCLTTISPAWGSTPMAKKDLLLIDGDQFLYEVTSAHEVECDWGDDLWTLHTNLGQCKDALIARMDGVRKRLSTPNAVFCLSDSENFRKDVLPSYKAQRKKVRKPLAYHALKKWAENEFVCEAFPRLEADDVMGILATQEPNCIIVSEDKDMQTIPGRVFRKGELFTIQEHQADSFFLYQALIGDVTDGYKGCPGMGPKTAEKLLLKFTTEDTFDLANAWPDVVKAYEAKGLTEADALQQARCARILRASDWDTTTQTVKLWTPK